MLYCSTHGSFACAGVLWGATGIPTWDDGLFLKDKKV